MDRYLLFAWNNCFPVGGWNDLVLSDDKIATIMLLVDVYVEEESLVYKIRGGIYDQIQLVDRETGNIIQLEFTVKNPE